MDVDRDLLERLYQSRLEDLRGIAEQHDLSKSGNVEQLRARLIAALVLTDVDLSLDDLRANPEKGLSDLLKVFGIKSSGSKKQKWQRLWLHLNHDPKKLRAESLPDMNRDELHALCVSLNLQRSGSKNQLLGRVAGVLGTEDGSWGRVKKSLRRGKRGAPTLAVEAEPAPEPEAPTVAEVEVTAETVEPVDAGPAPVTVDEGSGASMLELEARRAELTSQLREFLLVGRQHDEMDIAAFIDDLGRLGFGIQHAEVREHILAELTNMVSLRSEEEATSGSQPGSWRERGALNDLEAARAGLLDTLDVILDRAGGDIARARMEFELAAVEAGLDLDLPAISGRIHGLFDLQVSLKASEHEMDPVTARRQRALEQLYRGGTNITPEAIAVLERIENQMEAFERVVETIIRRADGAFTPVEHALLVRFLERRGWNSDHPEVRPRLLAAAGVLAAEMGYIDAADIPALPTSLSLDSDQVSGVVESMREVLRDMGREPPSLASVSEPVGERSDIDRVKQKLDSADELLRRLSGGSD
ncbi:MAG: hypothetical protein MK235_00520 [Candidatus Poseidoniales archaeon]|nr:hypothetical protein [Candidatus Poseidoniales archaeon]